MPTIEQKRAYSRAHYYRNLEAQRERSRLKYYDNKERMNAQATARRKSSEYNTDVFVSEMTKVSKSGAKKRNIPFHLTKEDIKGLLIASNGICALSGLPMDTMFHSQMKASIDRIDSSKGYTIDNVQIVARCVNMAKSVLSVKDFVKMCKAVVKANV